MKLKKHIGTTKDIDGIEFIYDCYSSIDEVWNSEKMNFEKVIDRDYYMSGTKIHAKSLNELKRKVSNL